MVLVIIDKDGGGGNVMAAGEELVDEVCRVEAPGPEDEVIFHNLDFQMNVIVWYFLV